MASDLTNDFARVAVPTRILIPGFTPEILADPRQRYVRELFIDAWEHVRGLNPLLSIRHVPDSRVFVTDHRSDAVLEAIGRGPSACLLAERNDLVAIVHQERSVAERQGARPTIPPPCYLTQTSQPGVLPLRTGLAGGIRSHNSWQPDPGSGSQ